MNRAMTLTDWGLLLLAALMMGSTFLFFNMAVAEISPLTASAARALIAAPFCWVLMRAMGMRLPRTRREWHTIFWLGLLMAAIPFATVAWGQQHIESGLAGILYGTIPIMLVVLAPVFLSDEVFTRWRLVGALVGLAGLVLVVGPSVLANAGGQIFGIAITFVAALSQTIGTIYTRLQPPLAPPALVTGQMIIGSLILTPLAFIAETPFENTPSLSAIGALFVTGIVCTAAAMSLFFVVLGRIGATRSALMPMFMPVVAVFLGAAILSEQLPLEAFIGLALILAGAFAVGRRTQKNSTPAASDVAPVDPVQTQKP